jgi:hypothetical protein
MFAQAPTVTGVRGGETRPRVLRSSPQPCGHNRQSRVRKGRGRYKTAADVSSVSATRNGAGTRPRLRWGSPRISRKRCSSRRHTSRLHRSLFEGAKAPLPARKRGMAKTHMQYVGCLSGIRPVVATALGFQVGAMARVTKGWTQYATIVQRDALALGRCRRDGRWQQLTYHGNPQQPRNLVSYCGIGGCGGGILWRAGGRCWLRIRNIHVLNPSPPQNATDALAVNGCGPGLVCAMRARS